MKRVALVLLLLCVCASAGAREIFVDNIGGDDRRLGVSATADTLSGGPVRTIARALRLAQPGDTIVLTATEQPYRECLTLQGVNHSGSARRPFLIVGNGAILDGSAPVPENAWNHFEDETYRFRPPRMSYQQLFVDDTPLVRVIPDEREERLPKLHPLEWCLFQRHIYVNLKRPTKDDDDYHSVPPDVLRLAADEGWRYTPGDYNFSYAHHPVGISLYNVRNVVITDLFVAGYQQDGINAHDLALNVSLERLSCTDNGRSGISVGGASQVKISDSVIGYNGAAQLRSEGYCRVQVAHSRIIASTAPAILRDGGEVTIDGLPLKSREYDKDVEPKGE